VHCFRVGEIHFKIIYINEECVNLCLVRHELVTFPFSTSLEFIQQYATNASNHVLLDLDIN